MSFYNVKAFIVNDVKLIKACVDVDVKIVIYAILKIKKKWQY